MKNSNSQKWKFYELDKIVEISSSKFNPLKNCENKICIELEHISKETGEIIGYTDSNSQLSIKNLFYRGQILFGKLRPYLRKYYKAEFDGVCSSEIWVLNGKKVCNEFLFYLVQSDKFFQIANVTTGSKMPRANWDYMKEIPFRIPPIKEQEKIVEILSHADEMINQCEKLIALKEKYKKGLMQRLLALSNAKSKIKPLRFKEFKSKWKIVRLRDILEEFIEKTTTNNQHDIISSTTSGLFLQKDIFKKQVASENNIGYKVLYKNQLVVSTQNLYMGNLNVNLEFDKGIISPSYKVFNIKQKYSVKYLYYFLKSKKMINLYESISQQGASNVRRNLDFEEFLNISFQIPSLQEQEKIVEILNLSDKEIKLLKDKLNALKMQKKGLMQRLLSGALRVK